jgi:hypothetical protein
LIEHGTACRAQRGGRRARVGVRDRRGCAEGLAPDQPAGRTINQLGADLDAGRARIARSVVKEVVDRKIELQRAGDAAADQRDRGKCIARSEPIDQQLRQSARGTVAPRSELVGGTLLVVRE